MKKKKRRNIRRELARKVYLDPKSETFLNKRKSLEVAGYSENVTKHSAGQMLSDSSFTDADLANLTPFITQLPDLIQVTRRKIDFLTKGKKITAKDYTAVLKHIELIAKCAGIIKKKLEITSQVIQIQVPLQKCPKCGYNFDIIATEKKKREEGKVIDVD